MNFSFICGTETESFLNFENSQVFTEPSDKLRCKGVGLIALSDQLMECDADGNIKEKLEVEYTPVPPNTDVDSLL